MADYPAAPYFDPSTLMPRDARTWPTYGNGQPTYAPGMPGVSPLPIMDQSFNPTAGMVPANNSPFGQWGGEVSPDVPTAPGSNEPGFWDKFVGTKETPGWGGYAIGGANSLLQGYLGMRQYQLGKKTLAENQRQFGLNYEAQRKTLNSQMEDRQRARVASGNSAYESVDSYMTKNRI